MYFFYGDESGFTKGSKLEKEQPITVFAGILIDQTKLHKAIRTFDEILAEINEDVASPIYELKFRNFKTGDSRYNQKYPTVDAKCDLLTRIVTTFHEEIRYSLIYTAICDEDFYLEKKSNSILQQHLIHPYLAAAYRVISRVEHLNKGKKNNKGKTLLVLDQQEHFQERVENLIMRPIHLPHFTQIIDTAYFGKSHHSKLIQIADLLAGILRYNLTCTHHNKPQKHFDEGIAALVPEILRECVSKECFGEPLKSVYSRFER